MTRRGQAGVALAICLWFLAGMSLLVSGIVWQAKTDTRMAQLHLAKATTVAAGDGAILLMLAALVSSDAAPETLNAPHTGVFNVGPQEVAVMMVPAAGLINLNGATVDAFTRLFTVRAQLDSAAAEILANSMVEWRLQQNGGLEAGPTRKFQVPEDMLQVSGMTRPVWDAVRDAVAVHAAPAVPGEPDITVAPAAVRAIFDAAAAGGQRREAQGTALPAAVASPFNNAYRVDAVVRYGGKDWLRRKWVELSPATGGESQWRIIRVEAPRVLPFEPLL